MYPEAFLERVLGTPLDAEVAGDTAQEDILDTSILEIASQSRRWSIALGIPVVAKGAVRINSWICGLSNNCGSSFPG